MFSVEGLYDHTQQLQNKVRITLGGSQHKVERQKLKLQLLELSALKPLTAKGYFSVSKETLTSMLSVRYETSIVIGLLIMILLVSV